ncbi:stage III sporulation protein AG [Pseudogracilibacillus auburnensis]|uniref:stage III sporulation protein AG n=1 Tax=Pseudogracilibacillus auburnensis TaxID=1494959 RepID=UPI001A962ED9|nr:stage III sporulation protein AG [Pseudogracilibacillus auburnensis]MBO1004295.1 stage III sporulation protein AG [Pseudogracilibacillus auburnensis]
MIEKIRKFIENYLQTGSEGKKRKYILVIALIGILLIILSNLLSTKNELPTKVNQETDATVHEEDIEEVSLITNVTEIEESYEKDLQAMLNQIKGVSEVEVMVNVDSTNVNVYEKDLIFGMQTTDETDKNGGMRKVEDETRETKLVYIRQGDQEVPILVHTKKPEVRGVFIIAKGAENATVKKWIVESVSRVLDVPTYRISVMPK